jgi:hypothetical protein
MTGDDDLRGRETEREKILGMRGDGERKMEDKN